MSRLQFPSYKSTYTTLMSENQLTFTHGGVSPRKISPWVDQQKKHSAYSTMQQSACFIEHPLTIRIGAYLHSWARLAVQPIFTTLPWSRSNRRHCRRKSPETGTPTIVTRGTKIHYLRDAKNQSVCLSLDVTLPGFNLSRNLKRQIFHRYFSSWR